MDRKRREQLEEKEERETTEILSAIRERGVEVEVQGDPVEKIRAMHERPRVQPDHSLSWPVFFLYPEFSTSDFVQEFNENNT